MTAETEPMVVTAYCEGCSREMRIDLRSTLRPRHRCNRCQRPSAAGRVSRGADPWVSDKRYHGRLPGRGEW